MARLAELENLGRAAGSAPAAADAADSKGLEWERTFTSRQKWAYMPDDIIDASVTGTNPSPNRRGLHCLPVSHSATDAA
jgi:hypothetical protein